MSKEFYQMVDEFDMGFPMKVEKGPDSIIFSVETPDGPCTSKMYEIFPYVHLIYFDIHARSMPGGSEGAVENAPVPVQFNYCVSGKTELMLDDNSYIYLNEHDFTFSRQTAQGETYFPLKYYQGINIFFDQEFFSEKNKQFLDTFGINSKELLVRCFSEKDTYIAEASVRMREVLEKLWRQLEKEGTFYKKTYTLEFLHLLLHEQNVYKEKELVYYTNVQVEIAKKTEAMMTKDLSRHISVKTAAAQFGVSETSLKNYFRGVFGKNISTYLREIRMEKAKKLLEETALPISEISSLVGYTKQGKFAEVFRQHYNMKPLEYRRSSRLKNMDDKGMSY